MPQGYRHVPVLAAEVLSALRPKAGDSVVDCTLGLGGHSALLLEKIAPGGVLVGTDLDPGHVDIARAALVRVNASQTTIHLQHANFAALPTVLSNLGIERVDAILADLGVASPQIDDAERGFSYRHPGPLDMRMDATRGQTAAALVNRLSDRELADALLELGDETDAPRIARLIVERRKLRPITT